jgi:hypothetical protein
MKSQYGLFLSLVCTILLSSCYTYIYINKTLDPEIIPEKEKNDLVFVNLFDYTKPEYVKEKNNISYHAGVKKFTEALSGFSNDISFTFTVADTLKKGIPTGMLTTLLPADYVMSVCRQYKANMLIVLDSMNIFFDWETIVETDEKGNKSKTKNFYLYNTYYVSLYSASGEMINRSQLEKSLFYKSRPALSVLITFEPSIAKAKEEVEQLALQAGNDYVDKFYPRTVQEPRKINTGKVFKESNLYIKDNNWVKAAALLQQLEKSTDPKIAKRASENLSVVREAEEAR